MVECDFSPAFTTPNHVLQKYSRRSVVMMRHFQPCAPTLRPLDLSPLPEGASVGCVILFVFSNPCCCTLLRLLHCYRIFLLNKYMDAMFIDKLMLNGFMSRPLE